MGSQSRPAARSVAATLRLGLAGVVLALAWSPSARAEPKDPVAREFLEKGQAAVARDDYGAAADFYQKALEIEREPKALYLLGQVEFLRKDCRASVSYFKQVREFDVGSEVESAMQPYLVECAERMAAEPVPAPTEEPVEEPAEESVVEEPADEPEPAAEDDLRDGPVRWYRDPLGDTLVGVGAAAAAAGGSLLVVAQLQQNGATTYGGLEDRVDGIGRMRIAGGATLGVGGALLIGGIVRWAVVSRRAKAQDRTAHIAPIYDGTLTGVTVGGRF
ncbi:MAG: hypothetical protein AAF799_16180 [Myxococcota bacterium]